MVNFRLLIFFLPAVINLTISLSKPLNVISSFRLSCNLPMNGNEKISLICKEKLPNLANSSATIKPTISPIIYPIIPFPKTMQYLSASGIPTPTSDSGEDINLPMLSMPKLTVNDSWRVNSSNKQAELSAVNQSNLRMKNLLNSNQLAGNLINSKRFANFSNLVSGNNLMSQTALSLKSTSSQLKSIVNDLPQQTTHHHHQPNAFNQLSQPEQLIQQIKQLNEAGLQIFQPTTINNRFLINQSQSNMQNAYDYDYTFGYNTYLDKLRLSKELRFFDWFFKENSMDHSSGSYYKKKKSKNYIKMPNSFKGEIQALHNTHHPLSFRTGHVQSYKPAILSQVYSTYLFPVYSPITSAELHYQANFKPQPVPEEK